jgi:pantoate--beta-alanine ligase
MHIFKHSAELLDFVRHQKAQGKTVGFVPTMGALHKGHISLLEKSYSENDITICSIYVNPIQFNNASDLDKYPRMPEKDMEMIKHCCDVVFLPNNEEMYPEKPSEEYDFGHLDKVLEGAFRPGHFYGVAAVVRRLFEMTEPHNTYFGLKDYQQLLIVKSIAKQCNFDINIVPCPIVREFDGLAMSSRNLRLSKEEREIAPLIWKSLNNAAKILLQKGIEASKDFILDTFANNPSFKIEYFEWYHPEKFIPSQQSDEQFVGLMVVWLGEVRLIDNIIIKK